MNRVVRVLSLVHTQIDSTDFHWAVDETIQSRLLEHLRRMDGSNCDAVTIEIFGSDAHGSALRYAVMSTGGYSASRC